MRATRLKGLGRFGWWGLVLATAVTGPVSYQSLPARDVAVPELPPPSSFQGLEAGPMVDGDAGQEGLTPPASHHEVGGQVLAPPPTDRNAPLTPARDRTGSPVPAAGEGTVSRSRDAQALAVDAPGLSLALGQVSGLRRISQLTGPGSVNATDLRWNVHGTDLGHMFLHRGELYMVFGDSFGPLQRDWRSNTMARIESPDPRHGLRFASMITDSSGAATELLPSLKVDGAEKTVIPTYGVSVGDRMVLHYMSVRRWGEPGHWELNYSGLAYSDDDGKAWTKHPQARWAKNSKFGQVAFVARDGMIYLFGIPGGRFGAVHLGRVAEADILRLGAYEYWNGRRWTPDQAAAAPVLPAPVGELSVRWSAHHQRWLMMYLNEGTASIVLRTARELTGPWSDEKVVTTAKEYPQLYAPYLVPGTETGSDIYFTMSRYGPYQVYLMRTTLRV